MDAFNTSFEPTRPPWKTVAVISGAVALAVLLVLGAVWFARSRQGVAVDAQNLSRIEQQLETELRGCAEETDPAACRVRKVTLATKATGAASLCDALSGVEFDDCAWTAARDQSDPSVCERIADAEHRTSCANAVNVRLALSTKDATYCDALSDAAKRDQCAASVAGPLTVANCASRGNGPETCDALAAFEAAVAAKDPDRCAALADPTYVTRCQDLVGAGDRDLDGLGADVELIHGSSDTSADTDGDGLTDEAEVSTYGSNPTLSDTDGDGFSDADEVSNGYNPIGAGRL